MNKSEVLNEILELRFSCRSFKEKSIEDEKIEAILEAGRLAPTACNFEPERIIVLKYKDKINKLKEATNYTFDAPVIFVICYDKNVSWKRRNDGKDHGDIDSSIVATQMALMATSLDLGTCFVASFDEAKVKSILDLPENYVVSLMLPTGYPVEFKEHNKRLDLKELVIYK